MKDQFLQIFTAKFLFENPTPHTNFMIGLAIFFGILVVAGILVALLVRGESKKIWGRFVKPFLTVGILGLVHLFARYESLPWLNTRFFAELLFAIFFIWLLVIVIMLSKFMPKYMKEKEVAQRFERYLPKAKK